jgi:hypothetical protein
LARSPAAPSAPSDFAIGHVAVDSPACNVRSDRPRTWPDACSSGIFIPSTPRAAAMPVTALDPNTALIAIDLLDKKET